MKTKKKPKKPLSSRNLNKNLPLSMKLQLDLSLLPSSLLFLRLNSCYPLEFLTRSLQK